MRAPWLYKGVWVIPASINSSGMRWCANCGIGITLKAGTKEGMRHLIITSLRGIKHG